MELGSGRWLVVLVAGRRYVAVARAGRRGLRRHDGGAGRSSPAIVRSAVALLSPLDADGRLARLGAHGPAPAADEVVAPAARRQQAERWRCSRGLPLGVRGDHVTVADDERASRRVVVRPPSRLAAVVRRRAVGLARQRALRAALRNDLVHGLEHLCSSPPPLLSWAAIPRRSAPQRARARARPVRARRAERPARCAADVRPGAVVSVLRRHAPRPGG